MNYFYVMSISYQFGPVVSAVICNLFFIVTTTVAAATLTGPEHSKYMPLIGILWGLALGWELGWELNQASGWEMAQVYRIHL